MRGFPTPEDLDTLTLPLGIPTGDIEALGRVIDRLRAGQQRRADLDLPAPSNLVELAETIYRFRRCRDAVFDELAFSDPSWDILLDLFIADGRGRKISVSSACIGAASPSTTALRYLSNLVALDLVRRVESEQDARVVNVELTPTGRRKVARVLSFLPVSATTIARVG
ncbi:MAG TPA: MarR family winged helix-turn-helix transcriptional regulator [Sphingomonadaceae bacterium]|nr:MarR family winged helix-turn-helix transcriptional regulator [Sphingomonadaceae bacterium]